MVFNFTKEEKEDASKVRKQVMAALKEIGSLDKPYSKNYCRKFSESVDQLAFDPEYNKLLVVPWYLTRRNPIYSPSNDTSCTTYMVLRRRRDV